MNAENFLAIDRDLARQVLVFTLSLIVKCFNFAEFEFWGENQDKELGKFWGKNCCAGFMVSGSLKCLSIFLLGLYDSLVHGQFKLMESRVVPRIIVWIVIIKLKFPITLISSYIFFPGL